MPLTDSYGQGVPYSTLTDKPNIQTMGQGIVNGLAPKSVMTFASAVVRGATITAPKPGMQTYLSDIQRMQYFDGTSWQTVVASNLPWMNIQLTSGYEAYPGHTVAPRVRREGSIVYLEGRIQRVGGGSIPPLDDVRIATIPEAYRPVNHYAEGFVTMSNAGAGTPLGRTEIWHDPEDQPENAGQVKIYSDKATTWIGFSSWWFVN